MPLNSVNTNVGARTALRQFGATATELAATQRRVASGLRVASVKDDGASWSIAQKQRGDIRALDVIVSGLQRAQTATEVARTAGETVSDLLSQMRQMALAASETSLSSDSVSSLDAQFQQLKSQVTRTVDSASFNGVNLVNGTTPPYKVRAGLVDSMERVIVGYFRHDHPTKAGQPRFDDVLTPSSLDVPADSLHLGSSNVTVSSGSVLTDRAALPALLRQIEASISNVGLALGRFGVTERALANRQTAILKHQHGLTAGVSALVDADMGKESAKLQAIQTREQLGLKAMSIANSAPSVLLGLFR